MNHKTKVLILTLNLEANYGGILQAYALQKYLTQNDLNVMTTSFPYISSIRFKLEQYALYLIRRILHKFKPNINDLPLNYEQYQTLHTKTFVRNYIKTVDSESLELNKIEQHYDALVVGSDQVWRSLYAPVERNLFDFAEGQSIVRISYAASFGRDNLSEYTPELMDKSAHLAQRFNAISVRENSGINLVQQYWQVKAEQHLDPTFLLEKEHYLSLIESQSKNLKPSMGNLFAYVLDRSGGKGAIIDLIAESLALSDFELIPPKTKSQKDFFDNSEKYQLPPVEQWLKSFADAEFVVTDSFHGTAFSIIFNKPFVVIGNESRGLARFSSLLRIFDLEDRLISDTSQITGDLLKRKIDWKKIDSVKKAEQKRAHDYLVNYLGSINC